MDELPLYLQKKIPDQWKEQVKQMYEEQLNQRNQVILKDQFDFSQIHSIGGADVSFISDSGAFAGIVTLNITDFSEIEYFIEFYTPSIPYIPSFLAFRELPGIQKIYQKLTLKPDILLFDGNGILHPLGIGIASHFGILNSIPTIGVAKTLLLGSYDKQNLSTMGSYSYIYYNQKVVGAALITKDYTKPVYVSVGHMITLDTAIKIVLRCSKYRIPEPIRQADKLTRQYRREFNKKII